jgi:hypothetical protein
MLLTGMKGMIKHKSISEKPNTKETASLAVLLWNFRFSIPFIPVLKNCER